MNSISTRHRLLAVLLLPFLMVLAGCGKLHADLEIQDVDTINLSYDLAIDKDVLAGAYGDADTMCSAMTEKLSIGGELAPEVESYEEGGQLGCLVSGVITRDNFGSDLSLTEEDGEYHLVLTGDEAAQFGDPAMADFDVRITFTFPGEVIESNGGEVEGDSVTYTDLTQVMQGVDIRADAGGFPWIIVIVVVLVLGFLVLLLLAVIAFFVIRARRNRGGGSTPSGMPGGYGAAAAAGTAAPQGQQWGRASPPPAPQAPQGEQPWSRPPQDGQQWGRPGQGQQPPQNPGW
ncbi:LppM family (lipo)protein [Brachybacterium vulturis]|uniref:LppM family (lipo)protein n=1 Tax=Brachybacterium vulturis TaxID=2017484 RepID=UPI003735C24D